MMLTRWQRPELSFWTPFKQLSSLRDEIDRLFESPAWREGTQFSSGWIPPVDVFEDKDNLVVKAELPGMKRENIEISLHDGVLTLSGERKSEEKHSDAETYRSERFLGRFQRTVTLPTTVNADKVQATYKDGVLTITLPKADDAKPRRIEINTK